MEELICVARNTNARVRGICGMSVDGHPDTSKWPDDRHEVIPGVWFALDDIEGGRRSPWAWIRDRFINKEDG